MTKMQNTILFLVLGTIANVLLTIALIVLLTIVGGLILEENLGTILPFIFIAAVIASMMIYQKVAKIIIKKYRLEEKMVPLIRPKKR